MGRQNVTRPTGRGGAKLHPTNADGVLWSHRVPARNTVEGRANVIVLGELPAREPELVAHELAHLILADAQGFPRTEGLGPLGQLISGTLNVLPEHPLVHRMLQHYGFDVRGIYDRELENNRAQLSRHSSEPDDLSRVGWIIGFATQLLSWEPLDEGRPHAFHEFFDGRFPGVAAEARELARRVHEIGYETPEQHAEIYERVIEEYRLGSIVRLPEAPR